MFSDEKVNNLGTVMGIDNLARVIEVRNFRNFRIFGFHVQRADKIFLGKFFDIKRGIYDSDPFRKSQFRLSFYSFFDKISAINV